MTSRVFVRTVCPVRYDWVKDLLPKLHQVDVYELSSVAKEEVTEDEIVKWEKREAAKRQQGAKRNFALSFLANSNCLSRSRQRILVFPPPPCPRPLPEVSTEEAMEKLKKRNTESTISDARARYLQRKQQRKT